jgi:diguanylate cyclase (GGDEF)-like protein
VRENDFANNHDLQPAFKGAQSELCLPLISYGEKLGVLALEGEHPQDFSNYELDALTAVADIFAVAIKNCQHFEAARQLAYRDGLTGVFNRRFFEERVLEEIERCKRYNSELAVLMIDIDQFKAVNDNFGHMLGDEVLKLVAQIFTQQLRKTDVICRYGGEEFVILLPQLGRDRVLEVAEKLRRLVHACPFPGVATPVSVSMGISHFPENGDTRNELIAAADSALYTAKQSGRNAVLLAPAPRI